MEMARLLRDRGEQVGPLVLLDSHMPAPASQHKMSAQDRAIIHSTNLRDQGPRYLLAWASDRFAWERDQLAKRMGWQDDKRDLAERRSQVILDATIAAMRRYRPHHYDGEAILFRPPLDERYRISGGRVLNARRELVRADNGWRRWLRDIVVHEVNAMPADHDGFVLEPHAQVIAKQLNAMLESAVYS